MNADMLTYYNRELAFFRRTAGEFADANPKIAGRLRLGAEQSEDPFVERMIEAFAYMNARVRRKIDDEFPEITDAMLGVLYPHYLAPVPSMAIAQFNFDPSQADLTGGYLLPKGTAVETEPVDGEPCRFRTCYDVNLWPVGVTQAEFKGRPYSAPATRHSTSAEAVVRIQLRCLSEEIPFGSLQAASYRFYLHGLPQHMNLLYEMLFNNVIDIAIARHADDPHPVMLNPQLSQVGFDRDEGMLPYPARAPLSYRLLSEFFSFPEKFLFFDVGGIQPSLLQEFGPEAEIYIYLNRSNHDLEQNITTGTFRMGCAPVVNLFKQRCEPIQLSHTEPEYRIAPDARRPQAVEVYSIDCVTASSSDGYEEEYEPFYSVKHAQRGADRTTFYQAMRRDAVASALEPDYGTDMYLSLVDLDFKPSIEGGWFVDVESTCLNRDLPNRLPFGGGQPWLQLTDGDGPVHSIACLTPPTATLRPSRRRSAAWKLISHLSLGHLSISGGDDGATSLQEILKLYDIQDSAETRAMIEGVLNVSSRRVAGRLPGALGGICRGVEVSLELDPRRFSENEAFIFASVLERFFALQCSINSFTQLVVTLQGREEPLKRWAPRAGDKVLL